MRKSRKNATVRPQARKQENGGQREWVGAAGTSNSGSEGAQTSLCQDPLSPRAAPY